MVRIPFSTLGSLVCLGLVLALGCGDDDDGTGGSGGSASLSGGGPGSGGTNSGGRAQGGSSSGGRTQGGASSGGAVGTAGAPEAGTTGVSGSAPGQPTAGAGGVDGGSGGEPQGGAGAANGGADAGGAGGAGGSEDPACKSIAPEATLTSHLRFTTDNECEVFVNGASVGKSTSWGSAVIVDVSLYLHPGRQNLIAIIGTNTSSQGGNDRGIVGELTIDANGGTQSLLVSDDKWRVASTEQTGWTQLGFDDSAWIPATEIAAMGDSPWGNVMPGSTAKWIWSGPVPADTANKPNLESTYARREFYLGLDGQTASNTPRCSSPE
ncbi:MAG: hypothetical protein QM756_34120 [Polyangiaceae bacterium]